MYPKSYWSISLAQLFQFLLSIWMIQNLCCCHLDHLWGTPLNFLMFLCNYQYILLDDTSALQRQDFLHFLQVYYLVYLCSQWMVQKFWKLLICFLHLHLLLLDLLLLQWLLWFPLPLWTHWSTNKDLTLTSSS